jgi:O-antigen/teichoic acid export membrane protein
LGAINRNFIYNLLLTVSNILFPIISFPYASRILGPAGIGKVQFVNTYVQYFILIAALGIPIYGIREIAKTRGKEDALKKVFSELLVINMITCVLLALLYFGSIILIPSLKLDLKYYIVGGLMLITSFSNVDWFFSGLEKFRLIAVRSIIIKLLSMLGLIIFVRKESDDFNYLLVLIGVTILTNLWNIWSAKKYFSTRDLNIQAVRKHLVPMFYIFSTVAAISVYSLLDTILLGFYKNLEAVGYYAASTRINKIFIPVLTSLGTVLIPQITTAFKNEDAPLIKTLTRNSMDFVIMLGIPITIGIIVLAPEILALFSGPKFMPALPSVRLFAPVVLIIGLSNVFAIQILTPAGKDKQVTFSVFIGLGISLLLNFLLIPKYSYLGATLANLLTEVVVMAAFAYFASKVININYNWSFIIKTVIAALTFFPIVEVIRVFLSNTILVVLSAAIVCSGLYALIQYFLIKNEMILEMVYGVKKKFRK